MRIKKKPALILLMIVSMLCLIFGAVACGGGSAKDAIEKYILPENETLVDADFTLPKTIGNDIEVTWKSNNTEVITIEDSGEAYTAKVTLPTEVTTVTLTVSAGSHSKDFTVRVDAFSVYTFVKDFQFAQRNTAVKEGFDLVTEMTIQGKKATIAWAIDSQYSHLIKLNDAKNKVEVIPGEDLSPVEITATFTYGGKTAEQTYSFSVSPVLAHLQTVNRYYSRTGYPLELSGYIVHVYEASESYGNATFYMIDDDFCSGYYCYRAKIDTADIDKFVEGAHIKFSGDTTKNFSGLWENNSGGTAVVDDKPSIDPKSKVYDLDTDLIAGVPSLVWHESTYVRLTGWKVSEKKSKQKVGTTGTLFTLTKGGVSIDVTYTKYINFAEGEADKLINLYDTIEVGNFVTVTGILGRHISGGEKPNEGFQVQPVLASDVVKVTSEGANENGAKVKAAVNAVNDAVEKNVPSFIAADKEFELPTSTEGVTISYEVVGATNPTVVINGGKFNVNPTTIEHNYDVQVTYTIGDYKAYGFFSVHNWKLTDKEIVEKVSTELEYTFPEDIKLIGEYDPPVVDDLGATITWAVKASSPSWISVVDGKIKVIFLPQQETEVTLVATVTLNSESKTVEVPIKILADPMIDFSRLEEPAEGEFIFSALHNEVRLYASSLELDGNYIATTDNADEAVKLTIEKSGENWLIKMGAKYLEVDPYKGSSATSYRLRLVDKATEGAVWVWDSDIKIFKQKPITTDAENAPAADAYFYIGLRDDSTFTTMSPSDIKYISGDNAPKLDVTQHPSRFGTLEKITHRHFYEYTHTTGTWTHSGTCSQPGCDQPTLAAEDCRPEQNVCPKCGHEYTEEEVRTKLFALESGGSLLGTYKLTGTVKKINTPYDAGYKNVTFTITVGDKEVQCYHEKSEYSATVKVGDTVTVVGGLKNYKDTFEFDPGAIIELTPGTAEPEPEVPEHDDTKYGSETAPLSVTQALALATEECVNNNDFTKQLVYMIGIVKANPTDKGNYYQDLYLQDVTDSSKEILVYSINLKDGVAAPAQHDTLVISGYIKLYVSGGNNLIEFATNSGTYVYALKNTRGESAITTEADGATVSGLPDGNKATNGTEITFQVAPATGKKIASVEVYGDKLTATAGTYKFTLNGDAEIVVKQVGENEVIPEEATIVYTDSTNSTNMSGENDANSIFGLDASIFTIQSEKTNSGGNHVGLNKNGNLRLYKNQTATLHIKVSDNYVIQSIKVTLDSGTKKGLESLVVTVAGQEVTGTNGVYTINGNAVSLSNKGDDQIYVKSIVITYTEKAPAAAATSVAPVAILPGKEF